MRSQNEVILAGTVVIATAGIAFAVGFMWREPAVKETQPVYVYNTPTTEAEPAEALEYVTDENWEAMRKAYRTIAANQEEAARLVDAGMADPDGTVNHAAELVEFGKGCERDSLLNADAERFLQELSDTADKLTAFIHTGGGETAAETEMETTVGPGTKEEIEGTRKEDSTDTADTKDVETSAAGEGADGDGTETLAGTNNTTEMSGAAGENGSADAGEPQENMTTDAAEPAQTTGAPGAADTAPEHA